MTEKRQIDDAELDEQIDDVPPGEDDTDGAAPDYTPVEIEL